MFLLRRVIPILLLILVTTNIRSQTAFYACDEYGNLYEADIMTCCVKNIGVFPVFSDLAVTPNGNLYGIDTALKKIDLNNLLIEETMTIHDVYGNTVFGTGLVSVNDSLLIADANDSLYLVNLNIGLAKNLGYTGYLCAGDLTFFDDHLYFTSTLNELIRFELDSEEYDIIEVVNLGTLPLTYQVYGIVGVDNNSLEISDGIYGIVQNELVSINTDQLLIETICTPFDNIIYGMSELTFGKDQNSNLSTNVITPNGDGINDCLELNFNGTLISITVINRWGVSVYFETGNSITWCGTSAQGNELPSGPYFLTYSIETCNQDRKIETFRVVTILN